MGTVPTLKTTDEQDKVSHTRNFIFFLIFRIRHFTLAMLHLPSHIGRIFVLSFPKCLSTK